MDTTFNMEFKPTSNMKTMKDYEKEIMLIKNENFELKSKLACLYSGGMLINENVSGIPNDIKKLLHDSQQSINILEKENTDLKQQISNNRNPNNELENLKDENMRLSNVIENMNRHLDNVLREKNELSNELSKLKEEKNVILQQADELIKKINEDNDNFNRNLVEKINLCEAENKGLKENINNLNVEKEEYRKRIYVLENNVKSSFTDNEQKMLDKIQNIKRLENEIKEVKELNKKFSVQIDNGNLKYINLNNEYKDVFEKLKNMEKIHNDNLSLIENLKKKNEETENETIFNLKNKIKNINNSLEIKNLENIELKNKFNSLQNEFSKTKNDKIEVEKQKNEIKNKYNEAEKYFEKIKERIKNLEKENKELNVDKNIIQEKYRNIQNENKVNSDEMLNFNKINSSYDNKTINQIHLLNNEIYNLKNHIENLENQIEDHSKFKNNLQNKILFLFQFISEFESRLKKLKSVILKNKEKNNTKIKKYQDRISNIQKEYIRFKKSNGNVSNKFDIEELLNENNLNFVRRYADKNAGFNEIISSFYNVYNKMETKIKNLERELKELAFISGKKQKNHSSATINLLQNFSNEFKKAREELDFCNEYLKKKGLEVKSYKRELKLNEEKIKGLEEQIEKNIDAGNEKKETKNRFGPFGFLGIR